MQNIAFEVRDGICLRGWFLQPPENRSAPVIIMTHGFSALKEHGLLQFAKYFFEQGFQVLIYDQRNFGESDGTPRFEVDPHLQIRDLKDAIAYLRSLPGLENVNIGLWGTSFSGGNVLIAAAEDRRVQAVVAQVPFILGHHPWLKINKPEVWQILQKKYQIDAVNRAAGKPPIMTDVVTNDPNKSAIMKERSAYEFFTSVPQWPNTVTLRSIQNSGDYAPIHWIDKVSPTPLLMIVAKSDTICKTELALMAYEKALMPKELLLIEGEHFAPYTTQFEECSEAALVWFQRYLKI